MKLKNLYYIFNIQNTINLHTLHKVGNKVDNIKLLILIIFKKCWKRQLHFFNTEGITYIVTRSIFFGGSTVG